MAAEGIVETLYGLFSVVVSVVGLLLVAMATQAYAKTERAELFYLAIGFTFVVAAMIATTVTAFLAEFQGIRIVLTVNYGLQTIGYALVVYGVWDRTG